MPAAVAAQTAAIGSELCTAIAAGMHDALTRLWHARLLFGGSTASAPKNRLNAVQVAGSSKPSRARLHSGTPRVWREQA